MPQQTKIFRVFVSSTFSDMREERRILQKNVFPKLEKLCESNGAKFQAVDLRWGVNEESQLNQKTIDICLNEIARCQRISPKPNFIVLLGNRYGWQPIPTTIPQDEMEQIKRLFTYQEKALIEKWYLLDENAIPSEYVLQPRGAKYAEYSSWRQVETEIRYIFRASVNKLDFSPEQRLKYFASATHQEIVHGALAPPAGGERPEEHVFAFLRNTEGLPDNEEASDFIDFINGKQDEYCKTRLKELKTELKAKLKNNCKSYAATWAGDKTEISDKQEFENTIYGFLEGIIKGQIEKIITGDEVELEVRLHNEFKNRLTEHFQGRDEVLKKIDNYLTGQERKVLALIGDSGSGKSSVMAKAASVLGAKNTNAVTVFRFIGVTSGSTNILSLLQNICKQIAQGYGIELQSLVGEGRDKEKALYEMNGLTELLNKCLALGTAEKPLVIFLDALDQLSDTDTAKNLYWIPRELPEYAKFVVSSLPELEARLNQSVKLLLPVLPMDEAKIILSKWLDAEKRTLTTGQFEEVLNKFNNSQLPIYLKLAFEKAKHWHSYDKDVALRDDVPGIINDFIDGLIKDGHDADFVENVICYMLSGRYQGLAENEILEILAFDEEYWKLFIEKSHKDHRQELIDYKKELDESSDENKQMMKIPIVVWSRFYLDMEPFLTERDADGVPIITFFHRQFNEVLRKRYKLEGDVEEEKYAK
ncbi:MAG: DUF4062 domain-containing protein [Ignavibacteriaceae bacterium]|nr:DUF4062 domain-containing protein [Ignavibacteriaceae bacterium]